MFAVLEVDDDVEASVPVETTRLLTQLEEEAEILPSLSVASPSSPSTSSVEKSEKEPVKLEAPPPPPVPPLPQPLLTTAEAAIPTTSKQHRSRRSLFHRNTIHICDQIVNRM